MESINLDMGDLFDNEAVGDDEDVGAHASHPHLDDDDGPMREPGEEEGGDSQQDGEEGVVENLQRLSKGAAKKRVLRPQPKLDPDRLKSERGIPILPRLFEQVKFKGKGHEMDDLKLMMGKLEHWAHRLFPKMPFDDFTERLEKLGAKKAVQTCVSRIRMDMPILDDEYIALYTGDQDDGPDGAPDDADQRDVPTSPRREDNDEDLDAEDAFEEMMRQEREARERRQRELGASDGEGTGHDGTPSRPSQSWNGAVGSPQRSQDDHQDAQDVSRGPSQMEQGASQGSQPASKGMTPDARARIEENKRKAMERRAARLGVPVSALMSPAATPNKTTLNASNMEPTEKVMDSQANPSLASPHPTTANRTQTTPAASKVDDSSRIEKQTLDSTSDRVDSPNVAVNAIEHKDDKASRGTLSAPSSQRKDEMSGETTSTFSGSQEDESPSQVISLQGQIRLSQNDTNLSSSACETEHMDIDQAMESLEVESEVIPGKELPGKEDHYSFSSAQAVATDVDLGSMQENQLTNLTSTECVTDKMVINQAMESLEAASEVIPYQGKELPGKGDVDSPLISSKELSESSELNNEQNMNED